MTGVYVSDTATVGPMHRTLGDREEAAEILIGPEWVAFLVSTNHPDSPTEAEYRLFVTTLKAIAQRHGDAPALAAHALKSLDVEFERKFGR